MSIYVVTPRIVLLLGVSVLVLFVSGDNACLEVFKRVTPTGAVRLKSWLSTFNEASLAMEIAAGGAALAKAHS